MAGSRAAADPRPGGDPRAGLAAQLRHAARAAFGRGPHGVTSRVDRAELAARLPRCAPEGCVVCAARRDVLQEWLRYAAEVAASGDDSAYAEDYCPGHLRTLLASAPARPFGLRLLARQLDDAVARLGAGDDPATGDGACPICETDLEVCAGVVEAVAFAPEFATEQPSLFHLELCAAHTRDVLHAMAGVLGPGAAVLGDLDLVLTRHRRALEKVVEGEPHGPLLETLGRGGVLVPVAEPAAAAEPGRWADSTGDRADESGPAADDGCFACRARERASARVVAEIAASEAGHAPDVSSAARLCGDHLRDLLAAVPTAGQLCRELARQRLDDLSALGACLEGPHAHAHTIRRLVDEAAPRQPCPACAAGDRGRLDDRGWRAAEHVCARHATREPALAGPAVVARLRASALEAHALVGRLRRGALSEQSVEAGAWQLGAVLDGTIRPPAGSPARR